MKKFGEWDQLRKLNTLRSAKPQELSGKEIEDYSTPLFGLHFWLRYNLNQSYHNAYMWTSL